MYLWGGVGRGKTFLMDLFQANAGVTARREHFHRFMKEVHARLHELRDIPEPLIQVAAAIGGDARVLCLDELYVSDIADAMILAGLFDAFVQQGLVLVCTSNTPPGGLYRDGLQRARFLPAIALLERHTRVINVDAGIDYRLRQLEKAPLYLDTATADSEMRMLVRFEAIAGNPGIEGETLSIEGRPLTARRVAADVVWFDFASICDGPRSQSDYVEIARDFPPSWSPACRVLTLRRTTRPAVSSRSSMSSMTATSSWWSQPPRRPGSCIAASVCSSSSSEPAAGWWRCSRTIIWRGRTWADRLQLQALPPDTARARHPHTPRAFLPYRLSILSNVVSTAIAVAYRQRLELSIPEWRVMAVLSRYPGLSAREVAERTHMDAVAVSRAVRGVATAGCAAQTRGPSAAARCCGLRQGRRVRAGRADRAGV